MALALIVAVPSVQAQHPAIWLLDKYGDEINPITAYNDRAPFSMEQTCGLCHDYETITEGFHFQMGWDVIDDEFGAESGRPWSLSNGFLGRWYPFAFRQLAKKENESADEVDLTVYDFIGFSAPARGQLPCGACHPGGGGFQYDRDGNRYDETLEENPELAETFDGDYYQSKWDKSGVVEADCFVCHLEGYDFDERVSQLESGNYQWAVVAGSRIGAVEGSVARGDEPTVVYNKRFFNANGTISLDMSWPPPDDNCMYCHGSSDVKKRGFSWNDVFNPDVHNQQGISCAACHPAGLDHQIAKGDDAVGTVAPEFDNTMKTCVDCHSSGYMGASIPDHQKVRPGHLERLTCESCHIPQLDRAAALGHEATTGSLEWYTKPLGVSAFGETGKWYPDYERRPDGKIFPLNAVMTIWWGNRDSDGIVYPLFLREHKDGWKLFEAAVSDDNEDGTPEVNRDDEIIAGLEAFAKSLQGNERFEQIHPVFIKSETLWEFDSTGALVSSSLAGTPLEEASLVRFTISHNVAPSRMTLGYGGCGECHSSGAHFFKGQRTIDLFGSEGQPITQSNGRYYGCNPVSFAINSFHQEIISPYVGSAIMIIIFLIVLHYHRYGPKRITFDPYSQEIQRFTWTERAVHLLRLIAFVILAVTGLIMAFNLHLWQELLFTSPKAMLDWHIWSGVIFIVTTFSGIALWFRDALFAAYDRDWVRRIGGYLGYKGEVPAGRFNAGQKMFYWYTTAFGIIMIITGVILIFKSVFSLSITCVTSTIHNLLGFVMIAGVVAHAYLGTIANPGTWRVLVDGSVTREWARHHHPNWYRALIRRGKVEPEPGDDMEMDLGEEEDHNP
jgi:formate dehydrogenase gamma subunit